MGKLVPIPLTKYTRKPHFIFIAVSLLLLSSVVNPASASSTPTSPKGALAFMHTLGSQIEQALSKKEGGSSEQRDSLVRTLLQQNLDLRLIGRYVIGDAWKEASKAQKREYEQLFRDWLLRTYARELRSSTGQAIKVLSANAIGKRDVLVATKFYRVTRAPIIAKWRVREAKGDFKVLDVVVKGTSFAATQRSEFKGILKRRGINGLLAMLRMKVAKLDTPASSGTH